MDVKLGFLAFCCGLAAACASDDGSGNGGTDGTEVVPTSGSTTGLSAAEDTGCQAGTEGCSCIDTADGECLGDLACLSGTCVRLPDAGTDDGAPPPPTTGTTAPPGTDDGLPEDCDVIVACEQGHVCIDGSCVHAWDLSWQMRVLDFMPVSCNEGISGDVDPDYIVVRDGELVTDSPEEACPATWPNTVTMIEPFSPTNDPFHVVFWDNNIVSPPQELCTWAWDSLGNGEAGPIPAAWLAAGGWAGSFDGGCSAEFEFVLVE